MTSHKTINKHTDHNESLHTSRHCYYHDVCKLLLRSADYAMNKSIAKFRLISNSIEISLVGRAPGLNLHWLIFYKDLNASEENASLLCFVTVNLRYVLSSNTFHFNENHAMYHCEFGAILLTMPSNVPSNLNRRQRWSLVSSMKYAPRF